MKSIPSLALIWIAATSLSAYASPTAQTFHGRSRYDQSPCQVTILREGKKIVGFEARGRGSNYESTFAFAYGTPSHDVFIDLSAFRAWSSVAREGLSFRKNLFSKESRYEAKLSDRLPTYTQRAKLGLEFTGGELNPTAISVMQSIGTDPMESSQDLTCALTR